MPKTGLVTLRISGKVLGDGRLGMGDKQKPSSMGHLSARRPSANPRSNPQKP